MPFVAILPVMITGIVVADRFAVPVWAAVAAWIASYVSVLILFRLSKRLNTTSVVVALFCTGFLSMTILTPRTHLPLGEQIEMIGTVTSLVSPYNSRVRAECRITQYRFCDSSDSVWHKRHGKVILYADSAAQIVAGGSLLFEARIAPFTNEKGYDGYARLMRRRGYAGVCFAHQDLRQLPDDGFSPRKRLSRLRQTALGRLDRLSLQPSERDIVRAMAFRARDGFDPQLRDAYNRAGGAHLLAVSGMHVGIVMLIANIFLFMIPVFRRGHLIRNFLAVAAIWLYALLSGASPATIRSALMFTGGQIALASSSSVQSINIMAATATLMLAANPNQLFDISFQLSFVAIVSIFVLYRPLMRVIGIKGRIGTSLWSAIVVGIAASIGCAPIVAFNFGSVPLAGILLSPLVTLTATIVVAGAIVWTIAPVGFVEPVASTIIQSAAWLQNRLMLYCAQHNWAAINIDIDPWEVAALYLCALAAIAFWPKKSEKKMLDRKV